MEAITIYSRGVKKKALTSFIDNQLCEWSESRHASVKQAPQILCKTK
jgi:hypothetical protein